MLKNIVKQSRTHIISVQIDYYWYININLHGKRAFFYGRYQNRDSFKAPCKPECVSKVGLMELFISISGCAVRSGGGGAEVNACACV